MTYAYIKVSPSCPPQHHIFIDLDRLFSNAKKPGILSLTAPLNLSLYRVQQFILQPKHFPASLSQTGKLLKNHLLPWGRCWTGPRAYGETT